MFLGPGILQCPQQRGPVIQILRQLGKADAVIRDVRDDVVSDLPDLPIIVGQQRGFHFLVATHESNFPPDVFLQEFVWVEQVVLVVLLKHAQF